MRRGCADSNGYRYSLYLALPLGHLHETAGNLRLLWLTLDAWDLYRQVRSDTGFSAGIDLTLIGIAAVGWWRLYRRVGLRLEASGARCRCGSQRSSAAARTRQQRR